MTRSPAFLGWTVMISAWGLAFSLACILLPSGLPSAPASGLADRLIGGGRQALSYTAFDQADLFFHKGVGHIQSKVNTHSLFQHWQGIITPEQHAHAEGDESAEILPWLKFATRADPRNVDAYLVASFWAETGLHREKLAMSILDEAQRENPGDYRIPLEKGRGAIRSGHFDIARAALDSALALQSHDTINSPATTRETALDRAEILTFLGFLHELQGDRQNAISCYKNTLAIFPERPYIKERVALLEAGREPVDSARSLLEKLTRRTVHSACPADHSEGGHDEDDHND